MGWGVLLSLELLILFFVDFAERGSLCSFDLDLGFLQATATKVIKTAKCVQLKPERKADPSTSCSKLLFLPTPSRALGQRSGLWICGPYHEIGKRKPHSP